MRSLKEIFDRPYYDAEAIVAIRDMASELADYYCNLDRLTNYSGLARFVVPDQAGEKSGLVIGWHGPADVYVAPNNFSVDGKPIGYAVLRLDDGTFCTLLVHSDENAGAMLGTVYTFQPADQFLEGRATAPPPERLDLER